MPTYDPRSTALVLIDLQNGVVRMQLEPYPAADIVSRCTSLAERFRKAGAPVVLVHVDFSPDGKDTAPGATDQGSRAGARVDGFQLLVSGLQQPGDLVVTKRQWGAFYGTELELQLRRRGVKTIVLAGIATNFGVESTARQAYELGFDVVLVEDGCSSVSAEVHAFPFKHVFPRISKTVQSADVAI